MKKRSEVDPKYKWKFEIFQSDKEIESAFQTIEELTLEANDYYGKFNDKEVFFKFFSKERSLKLNKFYSLAFYCNNMMNVDSSDTYYIRLYDRIDNAYNKYVKATSFVSPQLYELDDNYLKSLLDDPRSKDINNEILNIVTSNDN